MDDKLFGGERVAPNLIKRKPGEEIPAKKIKPEDEGIIAGEILKKLEQNLKQEAKQIKEEKEAKRVAERKSLSEIFGKNELH